MKSLILASHVRQKIDRRVDRLLDDIGRPEPPLRIEVVRDWLKIDLGYFQREEAGLLARAVHKIRVGVMQSFARPMFIREAIQKFKLRALCAPDLKRILIDEEVPKLKHRWLEAHETIHQLLLWHHPVLLGDNEITPTASCRAKIETEANYGAGQLIFLRDRFVEEARSSPLGFRTLQKYAKSFGNTQTCTLWRAVELLGSEQPLLGVISDHPHIRRRPDDFDGANPCRHFIQSEAFAARFGQASEHEIFDCIVSYCGSQRGGPLGESEIVLADDNGDEHVFAFETFFNGHEALTFARHLGKRAVTVPVIAI
ncbi:MAG TPA: DUF955 domain-containing protein [Verrucomicrobiota bacterium]|jgi:hypothetical protein|nr:DUF955 domain-containing protein [Verrucomicrobiota bacterium]